MPPSRIGGQAPAICWLRTDSRTCNVMFCVAALAKVRVRVIVQAKLKSFP